MTPAQATQLLLLSAIWGSSFLLIKIAVASLPALWVSWGRIAFGFGFLVVVVMALRIFTAAERDKLGQKWHWLVFLGLVNNAIPWTLYAVGQKQVASSMAAVLNATTPLWGAVFALVLREQGVNLQKGIALVLGFAGVILAVFGSGFDPNSDLLATILVSLAPVCYAIATILAKRHLVGIPPLLQASGQLGSAMLWLVPMLVISPAATTVPVSAALAVVALGVIGSGLAYWLYYNLLAQVSPTQVMAVTYLIPIWALFWGVVDGEPVGILAFFGVLVIILGVVLLNSKLDFLAVLRGGVQNKQDINS
jgi:drug/metabolite transporter (DMT)-like permease